MRGTETARAARTATTIGRASDPNHLTLGRATNLVEDGNNSRSNSKDTATIRAMGTTATGEVVPTRTIRDAGGAEVHHHTGIIPRTTVMDHPICTLTTRHTHTWVPALITTDTTIGTTIPNRSMEASAGTAIGWAGPVAAVGETRATTTTSETGSIDGARILTTTRADGGPVGRHPRLLPGGANRRTTTTMATTGVRAEAADTTTTAAAAAA
mmetsp:Transcript_25642/g.70573  ORF Transcript_25642/g.70573 Transcript_25642/m.70573 type:complete len:212 (-) Transcript_25642:819-1454(-)